MSKTTERERWNRTGAEIAAMFGVSAEAISNWVEAGAPKIAHNQYDERLFVPWVIEQHKSRDKATLAEEQARLTKHKADIAEMESAEKRGELVPRDVVREEWSMKMSVIRSGMLTVSASTPQIVAQPTVQESRKVLDDAIRHVLTELSEYRSPANGGPGTAAPAHHEPMGRRKPRSVARVKRRARKVGNLKS